MQAVATLLLKPCSLGARSSAKAKGYFPRISGKLCSFPRSEGAAENDPADALQGSASLEKQNSVRRASSAIRSEQLLQTRTTGKPVSRAAYADLRNQARSSHGHWQRGGTLLARYRR